MALRLLVLAASATICGAGPGRRPRARTSGSVDSEPLVGKLQRSPPDGLDRARTARAVAGTVEYDGKDVRTIKADVTIDSRHQHAERESRQRPARPRVLRHREVSDRSTFKSKRVEPGAGGAFKLVGDLTIRGTTKEVTLDAEAPAPVTKGMKGIVTGTSATTRSSAQDYGLTYNAMVEAGPVVGDEVTITIDLEIGRPTPPGAAH